MKNILTYISPDKHFNDEHKMAARIQIDNSIGLGWKKEDILLITNFEYEYNGVKSIVVGDEIYCRFHWPATKINAILQLFKMGLINDGLHWYHDFDCFQLAQFTDIERDLGNADMGLTNYGRMPRLCSASMFFKKSAGDIIERIKNENERTKKGEEEAIMDLINDSPDLQDRVRKLNITYAFHKFNLWHCYNRADKPIKAAHFHLTPDKYDFFVKGNNPMEVPLISKRLIKIFNDHGFK